jgi:adenylate kinase family enzyme
MLDGFPRTVTQAQDLSDYLDNQKRPLDCVINLDVPWDGKLVVVPICLILE